MKQKFNFLSAILLSVMSIYAVNSAKAAGDGTPDNPYTCAEVINLNNPGTKAWIKGYIVGTMNTYKDPYVFETEPPFHFYANIYLADNPYETNPDLCVPVQLASGSAVRSQLNLGDNPDKHRYLYALQGDLVAYIGQPGLKNIDSFTELEAALDDPTGGIDPNLIFTLTVSTPGTLQREFVALEADEIQGLVIKGKLNSDDLIYLNSGAGRIASVKYLDLSEITLDYDGKQYSSRTVAPEAGMGTKYNYYYILSEENYDEELPFDFIAGYSTNCYRNNMAYTFYGNKVLETVVLPAWMNSIGEGMVYSCASLKSVKLPPVLTEIGESAFGRCPSLTFTEIPSSIKKIGKYAFEYATIKQDKLQFDTITIGESAFDNCKGFSSLEITHPDDTIQNRAFAQCRDLKEIKFGEGLRYIGGAAFMDCGITSADLPESFEEIGVSAFLNCPFISSLPEEGNIRYLGNIAYELSDVTLNEYTVRDGTLMLGPELFRHAENQPRINLPESIEILGTQSLSGCKFTTMPDLPNLRKIGDRAFESCPLTTAVIPEKVTSIHHNAFMGCDKIWKVNYNAIHAEIVGDGSLFDNLIEQITLGDKVQHIPSGLFAYYNITEITLPASVTSIGKRAFEECSKLEYINLNDNITEIGDYAFHKCSSLSNIHWPAKLKTVSEGAFKDCTSLKTVSLPEGMESVGDNAFFQCAGVENLYIASTITEFGAGCFIRNYAATPLTITAPSKTPPDIQWIWGEKPQVTIKVPAASLDLYKNDANWNGSNYGTTTLIIPIETISAPEEETETSFDKGIESDTDLGGTVIGDVYVTIGEEDGYDETDGSIVLNSSMNEEYADAIGGMAPGESDLANRFNGLVVQVPAGTGTVTINCLTIGTKRVSVKIGDAEPLYYTKDSKGDITIDYDVTEDTYVYIYASETEPEQQVRRRSAPTTDNSVKIYSIGIDPIPSGIDKIDADNDEVSPITDYFRIDGIRVETPTTPGIYIVRRANGKSSKVLVK